MSSAPSVERVFWWGYVKALRAGCGGVSVEHRCRGGGGSTGIAAARELASRGASVAVLERATLGIGASTRNAGMTIAGLKDSLRC